MMDGPMMMNRTGEEYVLKRLNEVITKTQKIIIKKFFILQKFQSSFSDSKVLEAAGF